MGDMLVRFVSGPTSAATTLLDLMTDNEYVDADSWDDEPGELLGDPEGFGAEFGRRTVSFQWVIEGSFLDAKAARSLLAREILRESNWLMFRHDETADLCWYQLFRSSPGGLDITQVDVDNEAKSEWRIDVTLEAEPFIIGEERTFSLTVANDPASGITATTPTIEGDAPAPLSFAFTSTAEVAPDITVSALTSWGGRVHWQAETGTLGSSSSVVADGGASGGSAVSVNMTTTAGDFLRLSFAPVVAQAGTYRVMARMKHTGSTSSTQVRGAGDSALRPVSTLVTGSGWRWVNLGDYGFPVRNAPTSAPYTLSAGDVDIWASRVSTGPTLIIDSLVAVPVAQFEDVSRPRRLVFPTSFAASATVTVDADAETVRVTSGGALTAGAVASPQGLFPLVVPNATNVLHVFSHAVSAALPSDSVSSSLTLACSYRPRYLWVQ